MAKDLGHKFSLSLSQSYRNVTAVIDSIAAAVISLQVDGIELLDPGAQEETGGFLEGVTMAPWVNRLADGSYRFGNQDYQVELTDEDRSVANHGMLLETLFDANQTSPDAIKLTAVIEDFDRYPTKLRVEVSYQLTEDGLSVSQQLTNLGAQEAPLAFGSHPYFRIGEFAADELEIKTSAQSVIVTDERLLPVGKKPVIELGLKPNEWVKLSSLQIDNSLTDLHFGENGIAETFLRDPKGRLLRIWQSRVYRHIALFAPSFYKTKNDPVRWSVALEPQTSAANSFNTSADLLVVKPGETVEGNWGVVLS